MQPGRAIPLKRQRSAQHDRRFSMRPEDIRAMQRVAQEMSQHEATVREARRTYDQLRPGLRVASDATAAVASSRAALDAMRRENAATSLEAQRAIKEWSRIRPPRTDLQIELETAAFFGHQLAQIAESFRVQPDYGERVARSFSEAMRSRNGVGAVWPGTAILRLPHTAKLATTITDTHKASLLKLADSIAAATRPAPVVGERLDSRFTEETDSGIAVPSEQSIAVEPQSSVLRVVEGGPIERCLEILGAIEARLGTIESRLEAVEARSQQPSLVREIAVNLFVAFVLLLPTTALQTVFTEKLPPQQATQPDNDAAREPGSATPLCLPRQLRPADDRLDGAADGLRRAA